MAQPRCPLPEPRPALAAFLLAVATTWTPGWLSDPAPAAAEPVPLVIAINCGGATTLGSDGILYQADRAYMPGSFGYAGGEEYFLYHMIGGHPDMDLHQSIRRGDSFAYRFDLPAASYVVTLGFVDLLGQGPGQHVIELEIEGQTVLDDFDLFALAGRDYAVRESFHVELTDGRLDIELAKLSGRAQLATVLVRTRAPDTLPPPVPADFRVIGSYRRALIVWDALHELDDLRGYVVERASAPSGPFFPIASEPTPLRRSFDDNVSPGETWYYRVSAVDLFGNQGPPTPPAGATIRHPTESALPVYELVIDEQSLATLNANVWTEEYVPAVFTIDSSIYPAGVRYRGNASRLFSKKNWKVRLEDGRLHDGRAKFNLDAEFADQTLIRERLAQEMAGRAGALNPKTALVHLELNGHFAGVYADLEQLDEHYLERTGRDPGSSIYKCNQGLARLGSAALYPVYYEKETLGIGSYADLVSFVEWLNLSTAEEFVREVDRWLDIEAYFSYYGSILASGTLDFATHNYYLLRDADTGIWQTIPWDPDISFGKSQTLTYDYRFDRPVDLGTAGNPDLSGTNVLLDRLLQAENLRWFDATRILDLLATTLDENTVVAIADSLTAAIRDDAERDMWKWGWEEMDLFDQATGRLRNWIHDRASFLRSALVTYRPDYVPGLRLNELETQNLTTILDNFGEPDPWVELIAAEPFPLEIGLWSLSDNPLVPDAWPLPAGTLGARARLLVWADGETHQGPYHAPFRLDAGGGELVLAWLADPPSIGDALSYPAIGPDLALARLPDGEGGWQIAEPTPTQPNAGGPGGPPLIIGTSHLPFAPGQEDTVTVTAHITDPDGVTRSTLRLTVNGVGHQEHEMFDDGAHGDGAAGDDFYGAQLVPFYHGTTVDYYIEAEDALAGVSTDPQGAPTLAYRFTVGFVDPMVRVNEFMADNEATIRDDFGEYDDWVELLNDGVETVILDQLYITDDLLDPGKWRLPAVALAPQAFELLWADGEPEQGPLHLGFALSRSGEDLGLFQRIGLNYVPVDTLRFGPQGEDISQGRFPDGAPYWRFFDQPTPGRTNVGTVGLAADRTASRFALSVRSAPGQLARWTIEVPAEAHVRLRIYDVSGRLVRTLIEEPRPSGLYSDIWDGRDARGRAVASGVYFFRLETAGRKAVAKSLVAR